MGNVAKGIFLDCIAVSTITKVGRLGPTLMEHVSLDTHDHRSTQKGRNNYDYSFFYPLQIRRRLTRLFGETYGQAI